MITRETNGNLSYVNSKGVKVSKGPLDGAEFNAMNDIFTRQRVAQTVTNEQVRKNYNDVIANLQRSIDAGHPQTAPSKPPMLVIDDETGAESYVPFDPPLNDLKAAEAGRPAPSSGVIAQPSAPNLTTAQQQQQFAMVTAMYHKLFPEA